MESSVLSMAYQGHIGFTWHQLFFAKKKKEVIKVKK
jgi:hypothetical protein